MTPWVMRLLVANVILFLAKFPYPWIDDLLAFYPPAIFARPWTVLTYMFVHGGEMHLLFNMLGLYIFGTRVESRLGSPRFITLYTISGLAGAAFSALFTPDVPIVGASGGLFGVMMAYAMFWPHDQLLIWGIIPVEARMLVLITTGLSFYFIVTGGAAGIAHWGHLGGYAGGFLYLQYIARNNAARKFKQKVNTTPAPVESSLKTNWKNVKLDGVHDLTKEEVNRILDKISAEGVGSLTTQEKLFLSNFVPMDDRRPVS